VGMAWWNTEKMMSEQVRALEAAMGQGMGMAGVDGEQEVLGVGMDEFGDFWSLMKPEVVKRCFGDSTLEFTAVKSGFSTMYRMHPAASK